MKNPAARPKGIPSLDGRGIRGGCENKTTITPTLSLPHRWGGHNRKPSARLQRIISLGYNLLL